MENKRNFTIIAGPCVFSSFEELKNIVIELKKLGIEYVRAGTFKLRTSPDSFQGLRDEGMEIIRQIKEKFSIKFVVEFTTIEQVKKYKDYVDIIQIGTRNMFNYELLKAVGKLNKTILLKRGFSATYNEFINASKYISNEGNSDIILCERGIRTFETETRNTLDIQAIPYLKKHTNYKVFLDPSHSSGKRYMVDALCRAGLACGADGLIIEVHIDPNKSLCDSEQIIDISELSKIIEYKDTYLKLFK